jgi:protein O-mannosyl-transferase
MSKHSKLSPYLIICLFVLVVYLPSFSGDFILDDHPLIEYNSYIREWHSIGSYLSQEDGVDSNAAGSWHTGYYRPLVNLFYTLDYVIWGLNGPGFRITNLVLHMFACFALFIFYGQILNRRDTAFWLAIIFSLHPLITETVSWVASRNNILVTLFGILSFSFYIRAYRSHRFIFYILSVLFFAFAVFSKEFGLMLLPIFFLYQRALNPQKIDIIKELREYIPYILIAILYFILRHIVIGSLLSPNGFPDIFTRISNVPYILLLNLKLIFLPYNLHSYSEGIPDKFFSIGTFCGILFFMAAAILIWKFRKNRLMLFSSLAFFMAIFPVSGIISTSAVSCIAMRWLYFPAPFILIILAQPLDKLIRSNGRMAFYITGAILVYLGANSYMLNKNLWHSQEIFFKQEVLHFDNKLYADGMAEIYFAEGKFELAEKYYNKNFEFGIRRTLNYIKYAEILCKKGETDKALSNLKTAEVYRLSNSDLGMILHNRGLIYLEWRELDRALKELEKSVVYFPEMSLFYENIGVVYGEMGDHGKAVDFFKKAIRLQSKSEGIYNNLALSYILNNECPKAITLLERKGFRENDKAKELLKRAKKCLDNNS